MKTGRPKLKKEDQKAKILGLRFKMEDRILIEKTAEKSQKSLSDWARDVLLTAAGK